MRAAVVVALCLYVFSAQARTLPERIPNLCPLSTPNYEQCLRESLEKLGPHLLGGINEIGFPKFDPLFVPLIAINRDVNHLVKIEATLKNLRVWGFDTAQIKDVKFDVNSKTGEIRILMPRVKGIFDYEANGKLLGFDLKHAGHFKGDFKNFEGVFKFGLKEEEKFGVKYYAFTDFKASGALGDGFLKLTGKTKEDAPIARFITNFYNENPQRTQDAIQVVFDEGLTIFFRQFAEQILSKVPAEELIPK